jgi:dihydrofolate reductase
MGLIHIDLFTTLDGVAQGPGDPEDDFPFGGWQAPFHDEEIATESSAAMSGMDALLLGRRTYDVFAGIWPGMEDGPAGEIARLFNRIPKYVASRSNPDLSWANSKLIEPNLAAAIGKMRDDHENVHVIGSVDFVQSLLSASLFDRLNLWVSPITLGTGRRLFGDGTIPARLKLISPAKSTENGSVNLHYELLQGEPVTGDMTTGDHG